MNSKAKLTTGLALNPEQQMRCGDSTTAALRVLAIEVLHESQKAAIRYDATDCFDKEANTKLMDEQLTAEDLVGRVTSAISGYVVDGLAPLRSLAISARLTGYDPLLLRTVADRLAVKLHLGKANVDTAWAELGPKQAGAKS
ncbi:MAG: hypothetical protein ABJE95_27535 [Byssovorax sp.]